MFDQEILSCICITAQQSPQLICLLVVKTNVHCCCLLNHFHINILMQKSQRSPLSCGKEGVNWENIDLLLYLHTEQSGPALEQLLLRDRRVLASSPESSDICQC